MKFCKYCGSKIEDEISVCPQCNKDISSQKSQDTTHNNHSLITETTNPVPQKQPLSQKTIIGGCLLIFIAIIAIVIISNNNCNYSSCKNKVVSGYDYCYSHKCSVSDCNDSCFAYSNFCYSHYLLYDDEAVSNSNYVPSYQLKISNVTVYTNRNYTYAEGTVTNNSDSTVSFVEVKGAFKNSAGTVIDTDWTYAVGSEGLAPGESCKWKLSVEKDYSIEDCDVSILDYDY